MTLPINEFLSLECSTDQLILYNVLYFFLPNKTTAVDVFLKFFANLSEINSLFCALPNVK